MTRRTFALVTTVLILACVVLAMWSLRRDDGRLPVDGDRVETADSAGAIAYYTCSMHPSVRETRPGRCPICNMDLTPVRVAAAPDTDAVDLTFSVSTAKQQRIGVTFAKVERRDISRTVRAYGRVAVDETRVADVNLRVGGWIEELRVDFTGRAVRKGEALFTLYSPELLAAQSEYLIALRASQSGPPGDGANLVTSARERMRLWQVTDEQIRELESTGKPTTNVTIVSPTTGVVIEKTAVRGMRVEPGMTLYRIVDLTQVWIDAGIYEYELPSVRVGQEVDVTVPSVPPRTQRGRIAFLDPYLDPQARTARARIVLSNTDGLLKPEMYVDVFVHVDLGERLVVPTNAVLRTGERQIAFVDQGRGVLEVRFVTLGAASDEYVEVTQGLREGESVVSSANFLIDAESNVQGVLRRMKGETQESPPVVHQH